MNEPMFPMLPALVLAFSFLLHNLEETVGMGAWANRHFGAAFGARYRPAAFFFAATLLWLMFVTILILAFSGFAPTLLVWIGVGALFGNGLLHILGRMTRRMRDMPGFYTALLLLTPSTIWMGAEGVFGGTLSPFAFAVAISLGPIIQFPLAAGAIAVAQLFLKLDKAKIHDDNS